MSLIANAPIIYLITKGEATASNFDEKRREILDIICLAVEEKISYIQIREKSLTARLLFELTLEAVAITRNSATRLLVNDRAEIAYAAKADGVHLASDSIPADVVRKSFPKEFIVGVSTHSLGNAIKAADDGADFAVFGPVFETPDKKAPQGIEKLAEVCETLSGFPIIALGGIDESNVLSVLAVGAQGFAAIRALNDPKLLRSICHRVRNEDRSA